jgi:hypothetical protein
MTQATVSADGKTITIHIPITFRKRGGRKLVVTPDGAEWAPRPRVDNAMVKALARAFRPGKAGKRSCTSDHWVQILAEAWPAVAGRFSARPV